MIKKHNDILLAASTLCDMIPKLLPKNYNEIFSTLMKKTSLGFDDMKKSVKILVELGVITSHKSTSICKFLQKMKQMKQEK